MTACERTYTILCAYPKSELMRSLITDKLGVSPTRVSNRNGLLGWFYSTQGVVESTDVTVHLRALISILDSVNKEYIDLRDAGCQFRISCMWVSAVGNGGPVMLPEIMGKLAALNLELHFDIWFAGEEGSQSSVSGN